MHIRRIDTERKQDVRQFIQFPFKVYRDYPLWVPPLMSSARDELNRRTHPFYQHSEADFFVAESQDEILGRIAAIHNRRFNAYRNKQAAFFGSFEAVDDVDVARGLFQTVFDWAGERGLTEVIGPRGLMSGSGSNVLVEGFDRRPAMAVPYNPPYYDRLITDSGFEKETDYISGHLPADYQLPERFFSIAEKAKRRRGFRIKSFRNKRELRRWVPRILKVHLEAFSQAHTFIPPTDAEIESLLGTLLTIADPQLIKLVMKEEKIVGFIFAYPDLNDGLRKTGGRLWPFGWLSILREKKRTKWANINGVGLLPEYRGLGGNAILYAEIARTINASRFVDVEMIQLEENNKRSEADLTAIGVKWTKRHRSYRRSL